ncbi:NACHT domain-containing protein [Halomonas sp. 1390]|uniref:NACHT domain-containing protein n=1 Tax=Halomonas sp. B23F22_3 TaxID=3459516 RepID=UPI00373E63B1
MDSEGKFVADFLSANASKILEIAKTAYGEVSDNLKIELRTAYKEYLENVYKKYSKSKSFFIQNQSVGLYDYYVPLGLSNGSSHIGSPTFSGCLNESSRLVVLGTGGCGKTVLMKHLFLDCIMDRRYAPVFVELRDFNDHDGSLDDLILSTLEDFGFDTRNDFVKKAKEQGHFAFFLDGFDEVDYTLRTKLLKQIKRLSTRHSECPIVLSSRPDDSFEGYEDFDAFRVMPLSLDRAVSLIEKLPYDEEIKEKFTKDLANGLFERHVSFLSNPLLLSIMLLTYGENAQIPSKISIFYSQAYEALFHQHDAKKGGYRRKKLTQLDTMDFAKVFSAFALQTYDRRLFIMQKMECLSFIEKARDSVGFDFKTEDYLADLLGAACLLIEDGIEIAFSHRSFQEYFVAWYISRATPERQSKLIERYWKNIDSDDVIQLLLEMSPELIERSLIIPKLEELFEEIGVKRHVGITHATKFMKKYYKDLRIDDDNIVATYKGGESKLVSVLKLAVRYMGEYESPSESYFKDFQKYMYGSYVLSNSVNEQETEGLEDAVDAVIYDVSKLTYKTPVMVDLLNGGGHFSIKYLQSGFDAYKKIKRKHEKSEKTLDELLM